MKIAVIGFQGCGKSTVFKALTGSQKIDPSKPNLGRVKVKDERLESLASIFKPKKKTSEELIFVDLPGFNLASIKEIKGVEAVMHVIGVFSGRDYIKDIESMELEFMLSDLSIIEKRLPHLEKELKSRPSKEFEIEKKALLDCKESLEKNKPLRELKLGSDEVKVINGYQFLSKKPVFILVNSEEGQIPSKIRDEINAYCKKNDLKSAAFCAKIEAEIQDLETEERAEFIKGLGLEKSAAEKVIETARGILGLITFFTVKGDETKAWSLPKDTTAIEAAGKIHTDIKKGFIKAEVIGYDAFIKCGSFAEAKSKGLLKLEGKEYVVKDGDIIDFRFNV